VTQAVVAGAVLAWLGASLLTVAEARWGVALGLSTAAAGLALAAGGAGEAPAGVAALVAGGLVAAALRLRGGAPGWNVLPPGSTPRLVTAIVVLIGAVLVAGSGLGSAAAAARLSGLVVAVLAGLRLMTVDGRWSAVAAGSALALGLGALGGPTGMVVGAAVAAGLGAMEVVERGESAG
jgi:hypothetical protein